MEEYKSKYYDLDHFYSSWDKQELIPILKFLESADLSTLRKLATEGGVTFVGRNENMKDPEQLIHVLFADVSKDELKRMLKPYLSA